MSYINRFYNNSNSLFITIYHQISIIFFNKMAPLFKLLNVLARNYKVNLLKNHIIDSIFAPLLKLQSANYFKLPMGEITMYLELLTTISTLLNNNILDTKSNLFQETNIQFLVAMAIKHGNTGKIFIRFLFSHQVIIILTMLISIDQCCLALSLMNRFSKQKISKVFILF